MTKPIPTKRIALLGSTGSIGTQVLDVVARYPQRFQVCALAAGENVARLAEQIRQFNPQAVAVKTQAAAEALRREVPQFSGSIAVGEEGLRAIATHPQPCTVVVGLVGVIGLAPTLAALAAGKQILTANKETFVAGGHLVAPFLDRIIPIDSEHSAIHQCLRGESHEAVEKIWLTASGGPFLNTSLEQLNQVTVQEALQHPNWVMGPKITIDSATLMNKGLEVIEAHWLFHQPYDAIEVVIHPQSVVHSGIELVDGAILTQMGAPDMHVPIQYAMAYPERLSADYPGCRMDFQQSKDLTFSAPDLARFPCLGLAYAAGRMGSSATAVLNAADEIAVERFLAGEIRYMEIARLIEQVLSRHQTEGLEPTPSLEGILAWDQWAREAARAYRPQTVMVSPA